MCTSVMEDRSGIIGKNTENAHGPSHLHQHIDKSDPWLNKSDPGPSAYSHLSMLNAHLILSFLYSCVHFLERASQKKKEREKEIKKRALICITETQQLRKRLELGKEF